MADNTLTIRIEGDASGAQTAFTATNEQVVTLKENLGEAGAAGTKAGAEIAAGGEAAEYSMMEARHGVMLTSEALSVHVPRAVATMIASLGPVGAVFAAAFPLLALGILVEVIGKAVDKIREARNTANDLADAWQKVATSSDAAMTKLNDEILESDERLKEMAGDHMGALLDKIALIDHASLQDLDKSFDQIATDVTAAFKKMEVGWASWLFLAKQDWGSREASQRLDDFKKKFDELTAQGKSEDAQAFLAQAMANAQGRLNDLIKSQATEFIPGTKQAVESYQDLVRVFGSMVALKQKADEAKAGKETVAQTQEETEAYREQDAELKRLAESRRKDEDDAEKQQAENYKRAVSAIQEAERQKIEATQQGTQARIAAVNAAIADEEAHGLQDTEYYKSLQNQKVEATLAYATKVQETYKELEKAVDTLIAAEGKLKNAQSGGDTAAAADSVKDRMQRGVESVRAGTQQLADLYATDAQNRITAENLAVTKIQAEEVRAQAELQAALASGDQGRINAAQATLDQLVAKETEAQAKIVEINAAADKKIADLNRQRVAEQEKYENQFNSMFASEVGQVLQGHETMGQAALKMYQKMTLAMIEHFIQKEMKRAEDALLEKLGLVQTVAAHATAATAQQTATSATNTAAATSNAAVASTGAAAAVAEVPIVGPALAVGAATAMTASMAPYIALAAFDRGGMSEGGISLLHPREAVLNPTQTANFQKMTEGGGAGATKSLTFAPEVHVHGDFDTGTHMPQIIGGFKSWLKTQGVTL